MKKVNFNALQNFEVPESWIENAINAKPKKKLFHLNPLHLSTAACLVIAVSNSIFSPLNLNRNFTPLTGSIVEEAIVGGADNSSTFTYPKDEELLTQNEIKTTFLAETTKSTEKPKATGATEQNEVIYKQEINSEDQDNESSESENHSPARTGATEQREQPGRNEQPENTKKPEQTVKPKETDRPTDNTHSTEQESRKSEEPETTVPGESYTITTGWYRSFYYPSDSQSSYDYNDTTETRVCYNGLFEKDINFAIPENIWNQGDDIVFSCTITGVDENTSGICGTLIFEYDNLQPEKLIIDLSYYSVNIPCGYYDLYFECKTNGSKQPFFSQTFSKQLLDNDEDITL